MIRLFALSTLLLALVMAAPRAAADALLRRHVMVEGDMVTLGDLFDNAGERAANPVMRAPAPGTATRVDADWLHHVALVNGLIWRTDNLFEEAVIERVGVSIGQERIVASLQRALARQGASGDFALDIDSRMRDLVAPVGAGTEVEIRDLYYDPVGKRFSATASVPGQAGESTRLALSGRVTPTVEIVVPNRAIARGEILTAADLTTAKLRQDALRPTTVTDPGAAVGMSAHQMLRAGQPVLAADLQRPLAVARGALVTMVLSYGGMTLSAQGRAQDDGSLGDVIRAVNTHSNLTVEGTVDGTNHLRISLTQPIALAN